jgi:UDP-2-acetamido-3-amino-2,3-dideoxy-glucuronate N-acetyltransferase
MNAGTSVKGCKVPGVRLFEMPQIAELGRGHLTVGRLGAEMPFVPRRFFLTFGVPEGKTRGNHAHRRCQQLLVCTHGACHLRVDDGDESEELVLNCPTVAVLIPPLVWASERLCSPDAVLLVFASHDYEPEDYIRDYAEFLTIVNRRRQSRPFELVHFLGRIMAAGRKAAERLHSPGDGTRYSAGELRRAM